MDELIIWLVRHTGWTLEYTTNLVQTLPTEKLNLFIREFQYQEALEDYKIASNFAMIIANWASSQGKHRYRVTDFIGNPPQQTNKLSKAIKNEGIKIPEEK